MSWKDKLFTLINTRFYTKEEIDSKAIVLFINDNSDFTLRYNGKIFTSSRMRTGVDDSEHLVHSSILIMELPFGIYNFEQYSENIADMYQEEGGHSLEVNKKFMFVNFKDCIGDYEVTIQQEI